MLPVPLWLWNTVQMPFIVGTHFADREQRYLLASVGDIIQFQLTIADGSESPKNQWLIAIANNNLRHDLL
jgi:hypothetical protein